MSNFALIPRIPVPAPDAEFSRGIMIQEDNVDVALNPANLSFNGAAVAVTFDPITDTANVEIAGSGSTSGAAPSTNDAIGARASRSSGQTTGQTVLFNDDSNNGNWNSGNYVPATGIYTVPAEDDGFVHQIDAGLHVDNAAGEGTPNFVQVEILLNAVSVGADQASVGVTGFGDDWRFKMSAGAIALHAGDQIKVVRNATPWTATINVLPGSYTFLSVVRLGAAPAGG